MVEMINIELKIKLIEIYQEHYSKKNYEETVKEYFKKLGYNVRYNSPVNGNKGIPDLFIENNNESFYVECKNNSDGLKINQIEWILNNPNKIVYIAVPMIHKNIDYKKWL
jgi:Holliday junction resolvase